MSYPAATYEEREVIALVSQGDEKAFRALFDRYHHRLGAHVFRLTRSQEMAEEVVQDVFLKIWLGREKLADVQDFQAYLYVASKNHALNCLKKVAMERSVTTDLECLTPENQPDEMHEENLQYALIDEAIDHLPPQQRQVYLLSRHERLQYTEIADRMNISRETVKKYLKIASDSITSYIRKKLVIRVLVILLYFI